MKKYRLTTQLHIVHDDGTEELAASIGETIDAESFAESLPQFNEELNKQWQRVAELAPMIDDEYPEPEPVQPAKPTVKLSMPGGHVVEVEMTPESPLEIAPGARLRVQPGNASGNPSQVVSDDSGDDTGS